MAQAAEIRTRREPAAFHRRIESKLGITAVRSDRDLARLVDGRLPLNSTPLTPAGFRRDPNARLPASYGDKIRIYPISSNNAGQTGLSWDDQCNKRVNAPSSGH
jgi:hypothetical protein